MTYDGIETPVVHLTPQEELLQRLSGDYRRWQIQIVDAAGLTWWVATMRWPPSAGMRAAGIRRQVWRQSPDRLAATLSRYEDLIRDHLPRPPVRII